MYYTLFDEKSVDPPCVEKFLNGVNFVDDKKFKFCVNLISLLTPFWNITGGFSFGDKLIRVILKKKRNQQSAKNVSLSDEPRCKNIRIFFT